MPTFRPVIDWETSGEWDECGERAGLAALRLTADSRAARFGRAARWKTKKTEHIYHSKGWCRELWLQALGLDAMLPPPEEEHDVKSAAAAAKIEQSRKKAVAPH